MFLRDDGNTRSSQSRFGRKAIRPKAIIAGIASTIAVAAALRTRAISLALAVASVVVIAAAVAAPSHAMSLNYSVGGVQGFVRPELPTKCLQRDGSISPDRIYPESLTVGASPSYTVASQTVSENVRVDYSVDGGRKWYVWQWVATPERSLASGSAMLFWEMGIGYIGLFPGWSYRIGEMHLHWYSNHTLVVGASYSFARSDYYVDNGGWSHGTYVRPTAFSAGCDSLADPVASNW